MLPHLRYHTSQHQCILPHKRPLALEGSRLVYNRRHNQPLYRLCTRCSRTRYHGNIQLHHRFHYNTHRSIHHSTHNYQCKELCSNSSHSLQERIAHQKTIPVKKVIAVALKVRTVVSMYFVLKYQICFIENMNCMSVRVGLYNRHLFFIFCFYNFTINLFNVEIEFCILLKYLRSAYRF